MLGDLVHVAAGGQARADVEELADPGLTGQELDRPGQERPVGTRGPRRVWYRLQQAARGFPVGLEVVLAAEQVVIDPRDVRDGDV